MRDPRGNERTRDGGISRKGLSGAGVALAALVGASAAYAQSDEKLQVDALRAKPEEIQREMDGVAQRANIDVYLVRAADGVGSWRGHGGDETVRGIQTYEFTGAGTMWTPAKSGAWAETKLTSYTEGLNYYQGGRRVDVVRPGPDGKPLRTIEAVRGGVAWNEGPEPGFNPQVVPNVADYRRHLVWMTPQGVIRAAVDADRKTVKITTAGAKHVIDFTVDGEPTKVTLDANDRPESVVTRIKHPVLGETRLEVLFSDYKTDSNAVYFPRKIVRKLGGNTVLDLDVTAVAQNPYVILPLPAGAK